MTTKVEYALKSHRRDGFIEWIKGLLAVPFVLHSEPAAYIQGVESWTEATNITRQQYAAIMSDIEQLIEDQLDNDRKGTPHLAKIRHLVPSIGTFFTKLPLEEAFYAQDAKRAISCRRLVSPSFNDIRLILNTAQIMTLASGHEPLKLVTLDGDVTLYEDGQSLTHDSPVIPVLLELLKRDIAIGIVTAAGYADTSGTRYKERLEGILVKVRDSTELTPAQKRNLLVMGGESNFLFRFSVDSATLVYVDREEWILPEMMKWEENDMQSLLDLAEEVITSCKHVMNLKGEIIRKDRAVGIIPLPGQKMIREDLEEVVLGTQRRLEFSECGRKINFCAFNGGSDVWVDIGDKRLGVKALQRYLGQISGRQTLHVGDQFASIGANDFKARLAACTVWVANPEETNDALQELCVHIDKHATKRLKREA
ncbi:IMP-specific 5-nucleotidase [Lipomyces chichibuensis]|uniref:IMP-specific 5-nucleotidase n=1 Tax=Lipomyces chichibuensis TaxID=1546026 RepID=UPI0033439195